MNLLKNWSRQAAQCAGAILVFAGASLPAMGQQSSSGASGGNSSVVVAHLAEVETTVVLPDGKKEVRRQLASKVEPGKTVIYTTRLHNKGKDAATNLNLVAPVPAHTTLVENALFGEASATFSIDQGKSFGQLAQLVIDRDGRQRPARLSDVTHLKWQPEKPLAPGAVLEIGFKVQVN
jgi:uncharacterized repeat protein (TIGR01451 family)